MSVAEQVLIGFGSNQGESLRICSKAIDVLRNTPHFEVLKVSSFYRTEPVGGVEQDWFVNGVIYGRTSMSPEGLLNLLNRVENAFGRVRDVRWGPRTLDLDILFFGDLEVNSPSLTIPHPRLHERCFVLVPLAEIVPNWVHPLLKAPARDLLARLPDCDTLKVERIGEP